jgi:hypothetical protein
LFGDPAPSRKRRAPRSASSQLAASSLRSTATAAWAGESWARVDAELFRHGKICALDPPPGQNSCQPGPPPHPKAATLGPCATRRSSPTRQNRPRKNSVKVPILTLPARAAGQSPHPPQRLPAIHPATRLATLLSTTYSPSSPGPTRSPPSTHPGLAVRMPSPLATPATSGQADQSLRERPHGGKEMRK